MSSWPGSEPHGVAERFFTAWTSTDDPGTASIELLPSRLCRAMAKVLHVDGAGLSLLDTDIRVPLGASNDTAAAAEKLQFTLGEGPCLQALSSGAPVVATGEQIAARWPIFSSEFTTMPYSSVVSLPVWITPRVRGAIDFYLADPHQALEVSLDDANVLILQMTNALALGAHATASEPGRLGPAWIYGPAPQNRMTIWIALGMLRCHYDLNPTSGLDLLRAYAYSHGLLADDVATALVNETLPLTQLTR